MNAPNRQAEVASILNSLPPAIETPADDARRSNLFELVRLLNPLDGGYWGVLLKRDQGNKVPADIVVWRPTMEHFDVMTGDDSPNPKPAKPSWGFRGIVTNPEWLWLAVPAAEPGPGPIDPPPPDLTGRVAALEAGIKTLDAKLAQLEQRQLETTTNGWGFLAHKHGVQAKP